MTNTQPSIPRGIAQLMLSMMGYSSQEPILRRHFGDICCGDGVFLVEGVKRYCSAYIAANKGCEGLAADLEEYFHGMDIDPQSIENTRKNLNDILSKYGIANEKVNWDIVVTDSLTDTSLHNKIDYLAGDPPYYTTKDMRKAYMVFIESGLKMLSKHGKMAYITPASWTNSLFGKRLRRHITKTGILSGVLPYKSALIGNNPLTSTIVSIFDKNHSLSDPITVHRPLRPYHDLYQPLTISLGDATIDGKFYFAAADLGVLGLLRKVLTESYPKYVEVKNGLITMNDKLFVVGKELEGTGLTQETDNVLIAINSSTGERNWIIYPYDKEGKPLSWEELQPSTREYLNKRMDELGKKKKGEWWLYGRTQAVCDVWRKKFAVNRLFRDVDDVKLEEADNGVGVYGAFYILPANEDICFDVVSKALKSYEFDQYICGLGRYRTNGYYALSSKEIEMFVNYFIHKKMGGEAYL